MKVTTEKEQWVGSNKQGVDMGWEQQAGSSHERRPTTQAEVATQQKQAKIGKKKKN